MSRIFEGKVEKYVYGGYGILRTNEGVVFVKGVLPGEEVVFRITKKKKDYSFAEVLRIKTPSDHRVEPACPYYGSCGGCDLMHADYDYQVHLKSLSFAELIERNGILEHFLRAEGFKDFQLEDKFVLSDEIVDRVKENFCRSPKKFNYRNRVSFHSRAEPPESLKIGFHKAGEPSTVIDVEKCPVVEEAINSAYGKFRELITRNIWSLKPRNFEEPFSFVSFRSSSSGRVNLKIVSDGFNAEPFLDLFYDQIENVNTIEIVSGGERLYRGKRFLKENFMGYRFRLTNATFFQVNRYVARRLVEDVLSLISVFLAKGEIRTITEGYAGAGTFTVPMTGFFVSRNFRPERFSVYESMPSSFSALKRNLRLNFKKNILQGLNLSVKNLPFEEAVAEDYSSSLLLVDPPREGLSREVLKNILVNRPKRLIYVSCYPPILIRDVKALLDLYQLEFFRLYDMFPQTHHFEVMVLLRARTTTEAL